MNHDQRIAIIKRLGALCVFLAILILAQHRALYDINTGYTYTVSAFGYVPQITTQFLFWNTSDFSTAIVLFQASLYAAFVFIAVYIVRKQKEWLPIAVLFFAMGMNLWERAIFGGVIDYVKIGAISINFADIAIISSVAILLLRNYRKSRIEP